MGEDGASTAPFLGDRLGCGEYKRWRGPEVVKWWPGHSRSTSRPHTHCGLHPCLPQTVLYEHTIPQVKGGMSPPTLLPFSQWSHRECTPGLPALPPVTVPFLRGHDNRRFRGRRRRGTLRLLPQEGLAHGDQGLLRAHHAHVQDAPDEAAGEAEQEELLAAAGSPARQDMVSVGPTCRGSQALGTGSFVFNNSFTGKRDFPQ